MTGLPGFRPVAAVRATLKARAAYIDGEIAVLTAEYISDFGAFQEALGRHGAAVEVVYVAFDLLHLDGRDLTGLYFLFPTMSATVEGGLQAAPSQSEGTLSI